MSLEKQTDKAISALNDALAEIQSLERKIQLAQFEQEVKKKDKKKLVKRLYQDIKEMPWLFQTNNKQEFFAEVKSSTYFASTLMLLFGDDLIKLLNKDGRLEKLWRQQSNN